MADNLVLLPALITATRLVAAVRGEEDARLYRVLHETTPAGVREAMGRLVVVPDDDGFRS